VTDRVLLGGWQVQVMVPIPEAQTCGEQDVDKTEVASMRCRAETHQPRFHRGRSLVELERRVLVGLAVGDWALPSLSHSLLKSDNPRVICKSAFSALPRAIVNMIC
jgi:hypothetical protein